MTTMRDLLLGRHLMFWFAIVVLSSAMTTTTTALAEKRPFHAIIVGGSSGMGKAAAEQVLRHGGKALLVSRSMDKLRRAKQELLNQCSMRDEDVQLASVDCTDEQQVQEWAHQLQDDTWDGLVCTAAGRAPHGPIVDLDTAASRDMMETKLWAAYHVAKYVSPKLRPGGAVVFCAGILNRRPGMNCVPLAMANGALEGLTRTAALEWGPDVRVNCLSPGFCATERFDHLSDERREAMFVNTAASLPLRKIGQPADMGQAIYYLLTAPFCTGVVLDVDGGHGIRQYASAQTDPLRQRQRQ